MEEKIKVIMRNALAAKEGFVKESGKIAAAAGLIIDSLKAGNKVLIFGNGGSAADSQHMAAELVGRFKKERNALAAVALTTDTSLLTAIANDYGFKSVFTRQIEALAKKGDVAFGISTSGNSPNVIEALKRAGAMGLKTIGLTGEGGGRMKGTCGVLISAPSKDTPRIQECHIAAIHAICEVVEEGMAE